MNGLPSSVKTSPNSLITTCVELLGKSPHNQVLGEVVSNHQVIHLVPIEQICAQSVPCMRRHVTHISNWFGCPGTCLNPQFHIPHKFPVSSSLMDIIGNAWPEYRVSCFEHALSNTQMSIMYLFQYLLPQCGRV